MWKKWGYNCINTSTLDLWGLRKFALCLWCFICMWRSLNSGYRICIIRHLFVALFCFLQRCAIVNSTVLRISYVKELNAFDAIVKILQNLFFWSEDISVSMCVVWMIASLKWWCNMSLLLSPNSWSFPHKKPPNWWPIWVQVIYHSKKTPGKIKIFFLPSLGENLERKKNPTYEQKSCI